MERARLIMDSFQWEQGKWKETTSRKFMNIVFCFVFSILLNSTTKTLEEIDNFVSSLLSEIGKSSFIVCYSQKKQKCFFWEPKEKCSWAWFLSVATLVVLFAITKSKTMNKTASRIFLQNIFAEYFCKKMRSCWRIWMVLILFSWIFSLLRKSF